MELLRLLFVVPVAIICCTKGMKGIVNVGIMPKVQMPSITCPNCLPPLPNSYTTVKFSSSVAIKYSMPTAHKSSNSL